MRALDKIKKDEVTRAVIKAKKQTSVQSRIEVADRYNRVNSQSPKGKKVSLFKQGVTIQPIRGREEGETRDLTPQNNVQQVRMIKVQKKIIDKTARYLSTQPQRQE